MRSNQPCAGSHPLFPVLSLKGIEMRCEIWSPLNSPDFSGCQTSDACQHPKGRGEPFLFLISLNKPLSATMPFLHGRDSRRGAEFICSEKLSTSPLRRAGCQPLRASYVVAWPQATLIFHCHIPLHCIILSPMAIPDQHNLVLDLVLILCGQCSSCKRQRQAAECWTSQWLL